MRKAKIFLSLMLSLSMLLSMSIHSLAASSELRNVDYFETENYTIWGEVDADGILYVVMAYKNGDMYVSSAYNNYS